MKIIMKMALICCILSTFLRAMESSEIQDSSSIWLKTLKGIGTGAALAIVEACSTGTPLQALKNASQNGELLTRGSIMRFIRNRGLRLWRGCVGNGLSMVPITASQVGCSTLVRSFLARGVDEEVSDRHKMVAAIAGGIGAATIACPAEAAFLYQQQHRRASLGQAYTTLWQLRGGLMRGFIPTACRDAGFTAGYIALLEIAADWLQRAGTNPTIAGLVASIAVGVPTALFTHPLDTIKTRLQLDVSIEQYRGMTAALKDLYHIHGIAGFYHGWQFRTARIVCALAWMDFLTRCMASEWHQKAIVDDE